MVATGSLSSRGSKPCGTSTLLSHPDPPQGLLPNSPASQDSPCTPMESTLPMRSPGRFSTHLPCGGETSVIAPCGKAGAVGSRSMAQRCVEGRTQGLLEKPRPLLHSSWNSMGEKLELLPLRSLLGTGVRLKRFSLACRTHAERSQGCRRKGYGQQPQIFIQLRLRAVCFVLGGPELPPNIWRVGQRVRAAMACAAGLDGE